MSFRDIYFGFATNKKYGHSLVASVEKRWALCEQPLFLLGFALHPGFRDHMQVIMRANPAVFSLVMDASVYYYRRYIGEAFGLIRTQLETWYSKTALEINLEEYAHPDPQYWRHVFHEYGKVSELAITVLSIAVNTATCERLFSALGAIHAPTRTRLQAEKVRKLFIVQKRVRDADAGAQKRKKVKRIIDSIEGLSSLARSVCCNYI
ncbi:hypothetical protein PINS_up007208 [Pythium insidiosum]|nr:hypothetical protein PINS_up007208 [Pythium insidiosum]